MTNLLNKMYFKGMELKTRMSRLWNDERGETNIIAIILILVIVIGLVIMFGDNITEMVEDIWTRIEGDAAGIYGAQPE